MCLKTKFILVSMAYLLNNLEVNTRLSLILLQRELEGYKFPVFTTESCPKNETEWEARAAVFFCLGESSYACLPNENFTELLEFCYPAQVISIHQGKVM